jgi:ribosomal protein S4E
MISNRGEKMQNSNQAMITAVEDGDFCEVIGGTHAGKSGTARDIKISKSGSVTITIVQSNGERFKTLAKNVVVKKSHTA